MTGLKLDRHCLNDRQHLADALECIDAEYVSDLLKEGGRVKRETVGEKVYLRGLIEISNICRKNCLYCGIRRDNQSVQRYALEKEQILQCAARADELKFGSICIQAGERNDREFISFITDTILAIKRQSDGRTGITLSLGEQSRETLQEWFDAGAHRYLLRIEASNPLLYSKIHPQDGFHSYDARIRTLQDLKEIGYQTGSGVMIGLPGQTAADLADDLLFLKEFDIDMVGMGPYIPHPCTPLSSLPYPSDGSRLELSLKMISLLRILMPDINIAATTALEVLAPDGRLRALEAGANIVMPNLSPDFSRKRYTLYDKKETLAEDTDLGGNEIGYGQWGDSLHFSSK